MSDQNKQAVVDQEKALQALNDLRDKIAENIKGKIEPIERAIAELKEQASKGANVEEQLRLATSRLDQLQAQLERPERDQPSAIKTPAELLHESEEFTRFAQQASRKGSAAIKLESFFPEMKTLIDSTAVGSSTPGILVPQRVAGVMPLPRRTLRIRDLLPVNRTTNNAVEFVKENAFTNAASPQGAEGTSKAESALTFTIDSAPVTTIAHWIPASRQVLDDFGALRERIDSNLMYGLKLREETELLAGDGLGTHISGLITEAAAYAGSYNVGGDTRIDRIRRAITEMEVIDEVDSGLVLNPVDMMHIDLIKDEFGGANTGRYIVGNPITGVIVPTLWGLPVVISNTMPVGRFLIGAFSSQCAIWDRMQATLEVSTDHADYFVRNLVAVRCEERLALTVYRSTAFRYGAF